MKTIKLYHQHPFLIECEAEVTRIDEEKGIVLDQSVAYPESGGQMGDTGVLVTESNGVKEKIAFTDTQKGVGRILLIPEFPSIPVETPTYHVIDKEHLSKFYVGQKVVVNVDPVRRGLLTVSHSGIHLVLMGLAKKYPGMYNSIRGCSIKPDGARLDFRIENKFTADDVLHVQDFMQNQIALRKDMYVFQHKQEEEAWYWQMDDYIIPCGGTHLTNTCDIGDVSVKKENLGKSAQRMSFTFSNHKIPIYDTKENK